MAAEKSSKNAVGVEMIPEEVTRQIVQIIKKHQPARHYKLFLFGSRATGKSINQSDYDVGIDTNENIPLEKAFEIKEELEELPILQKIDFVDFASVSENFKKHALNNMKVLYEQ